MHRPPRATGIGSLPGTDIGAAHRLVFDELPDLPHLPELPARGVGADMIGRGTALLVDFHAEVQPSGWRLTERPGRDARRAESFLRQDLDFLEENAQEFTQTLKVQAVGPWTLASTLELKYGDRMLADLGAVRDLAESLTEGLKEHLAELRKRVPRAATLLLQLDEPALPGVLKGTVPTASGFGRLRAVEEPVARELLAGVLKAARDAGAETSVHCCAPDVPIELLRHAGAGHISFDASRIETETARDEQLGEAIEAGVGLMLGVVPATDPGRAPEVTRLLDKVLSLTRLGFSPAQLAEATTITPTCGLAGATPPWARQALVLAHRTADALADKAS
ncbi:Methionine synthase vitamin-B12 independent [Catenulispora acidiphila DSM 44928]|uniref:Methionine synthase vitamin-B12 independent n=1 Tax=Catenulispora acidiphila (strain DSM 44928 / JCM 14897 / NBRC 102108 / NRRL B-24433 / ID139908) TaxID=479433 RepID=C7Q7E8_CATAD|nr:methionine synthase [Catenulispora acidiphila]ACU70236.1 Methionine synthase vitamin-B12 independent [Catenulispora acidiphila DSM 44928]